MFTRRGPGLDQALRAAAEKGELRLGSLRRSRMQGLSRAAVSGLVALIFCYVVVFMPLPYYIFVPGTAEDVRPMVHLAQEPDPHPEKGAFLLTTVGVTRSNVIRLFEAKLRDYDIRKISDVRQGGENDREYGERQRAVMLSSQADAIQAAYRKAGISYRIESLGLSVLRVRPDYPASGVLEAGDRLVSVDGVPVRTGPELAEAFRGKKAGDLVRVGYRRGNAESEAELELKPLPAEEGAAEERAGIGIVTGELLSVQADRADRQVTIEAGDIGGPSAGFMFAMEAYDRLTHEDWTKGYRIAGTGTVDPGGRIGPIGGIRFKVAAADREGADIFFAPNNPGAGDGGAQASNAAEAEKAARKLGSSMKIVPVATMDEALDYLSKLPPKEAP